MVRKKSNRKRLVDVKTHKSRYTSKTTRKYSDGSTKESYGKGFNRSHY